MAKKPKPEPDDPEQSKRFEETARELCADRTGKDFERAFESTMKPQMGQKKTSRDSS